MASPHARLNKGAKAGAAQAATHLDALTRAYARALRAAGRRAATQLRQTETLTAAANPKPPDWTPPPVDQILDANQLAADTKRKTARLHKLMLAAAAEETLRPLGLSFDITAPTSQALLDSVGQRIQDGIAAAIREQINEAIKDGYANGDSVRRVSQQIQAATDKISRPRADMLARTDLNALANGGSLLAATVSGAAATKTWVTAADDKVREMHVEADGQTVPINEPFDVCGQSPMYPADPILDDECAANCRCVQVYGEPLTAASVPSGVLYLARHGLTAYDSDDHVRDEIRGWTDDPLNDAGLIEADKLAESLADFDIRTVETSDLQRASVTADRISARLDVLAQPTDRLRPWNLGDLQGRTSEDAADEIAGYVTDPELCVPGGESFNDFCGRFLPAVAEAMAEAQNGSTVLLVSHSHNLKLAKAWIENGRQQVCADEFMAPSPAPASVLAVTPAGGGWQVAQILEDGAPVGEIGSVPAWAHYRPATDQERCDTCAFYDAGLCTMFDARVIADYTCDEWVADKPTMAVTSGGNMTTETLVAAVSGDTGLPLSERDRVWDAAAATGRVKKWASSDGSGDPDTIDYGKLGRAYFWKDSPGSGGPKIGDFHLPFADIIGGKLTAVWRGVTAVAGRLNQTEGVDEKAVQAKAAVYYRKAAKQYGDDSIKPPWASGSAAADGERLAAIRAHLADHGADILDDDELRAMIITLEVLSDNRIGPVVHFNPINLELGDVSLSAAADGGTQWQATLCVAGEPTVDSGMKRVLMVDGGSWLPLPLPLGLLDDTPHADVTMKSPVVGRIDQIWFAGNVVQASGVFFDASPDPKLQEQASKAAALVGEMQRMGISVDLVDTDIEMMVWNDSTLDAPNDPTATEMTDAPPGGPVTEANLPNDISDAEALGDIDELEYVYAFNRWVIAGATICPVQALTDATISLVASAVARTGEWRSVTVFETPALTAAAAGLVPVEPPAAWFDDPELEGPTPLTITDEGRVFGHLATWDTCHTGKPGCVPPPRSPTGYMNFHLGEIKTAEGDRVAVGTLTFDGPHAALPLSASQTVRHYDDTTTAGAHVRAGEDAHGIWLAGALNPRLSAEDARTLMAATPSGDWRQVNRGEDRDLVGAHAVNQPGFIVQRRGLSLAADAGCVPCEEEYARQVAVLAAAADGIEGLAALAEV